MSISAVLPLAEEVPLSRDKSEPSRLPSPGEILSGILAYSKDGLRPKKYEKFTKSEFSSSQPLAMELNVF